MKAKIYGFDLEGTPQEVMEFKKLMDNQKQTYTYPYVYPYTQPFIYTQPSTGGNPPFKWNEITCQTGASLQGNLKTNDCQVWN